MVWALTAYFGTQALYTADSNTPAAVLFVAWASAPVLPALLVFGTLLVGHTWPEAIAAAVATAIGGGAGVGVSLATFFVAFLLLPDAPTWPIIIGIPSAATVASAATGGAVASVATTTLLTE